MAGSLGQASTATHHACRMPRTMSASSRGGPVDVVVDDRVRELALRRELLLRHPQPRLDRLGVVGAAALQPPPQVGRIGRRDEDLHRLGHARADLPGALQLDLEHDRGAALVALLDLRAQRSVPVAAVGRVLDEVPASTAAVELVGFEEVVVDAVLLAGPGAPRRRRGRQLELGNELAEGADQRFPCRRRRDR